MALPGDLAVKYSNAPYEWAWQWVFPATRFYKDAASGTLRRHHLHESVLQKAVKRAGLQAGLPRAATCHALRHSFATICSNPATTSARSRNCSATAT